MLMDVRRADNILRRCKFFPDHGRDRGLARPARRALARRPESKSGLSDRPRQPARDDAMTVTILQGDVRDATLIELNQVRGHGAAAH